jgi:alpha-beta hydrolase superfamily lysophospholipase
LLHGTGEHAERYAPFARRLADQGFVVGAHDHPGHGRSDGKRGLIDPPGALVTQAAIQIQSFALEIGRAPIVFGHSLGGTVATELLLQHGLDMQALMLSAPAFVPHMSALDRMKLNVLFQAAPTLCIELPYKASLLTSDVEQQAIANADPLIHGFKSASLIGWLVQSGRRSLELAETLNVDTLLLIAGADPVVDSAKIREFAERAPQDRISVHDYPDSLHELLNEVPAQREQVMQDIDQWLSRFD